MARANNSIPRHMKELLQRIGQHEVGHWIAAKESGFKTNFLSVKLIDTNGSYEGGSEIILALPTETKKKIVDYLEKRVIILYSGVVAEWLKNDEINIDEAVKSLTVTAINDSTKVTELCNILRNITHADETDQSKMNETLKLISGELWSKSLDLVIKSKEVIYGLGGRLATEVKSIGKEYRLSKEEIENLPAIKEYLDKIH